MKSPLPWLASACLTCVLAPAAATDFHTYYLGGQSNMDGYGYVAELPDGMRASSERVMIFTGDRAGDDQPGGGIGHWESLRPGHGTGFRSDGTRNEHSDRFGPELTFGRAMAESHPKRHIALIKYSHGGTALKLDASGYGTWALEFEGDTGLNQYDHALAAIRNAHAVRDIDGDGQPDRLIPAGIMWMQGEADAYHSQAAADDYRENLERMMDLLRAAMRVDGLPVVIGKITDSGMGENGRLMPYIATVQQAQREFARADLCAVVSTVTDNLQYSDDGWHYDSAGYLAMGRAFADAMVALESRCGFE